MPVSRHRDVEDVPAHTAPRLDPENLRRVLAWSAFCRRLRGGSQQPGVFRYRSVDEASAARERPRTPPDGRGG